MTISFGLVPARASFTLSSDADFYQVVTTSDRSNFPGTATLTLKLYDSADTVLATWSATIVGANASFSVDKAVVATALASSPVQGRVFYDDGTGLELLLARGDIHVVSP